MKILHTCVLLAILVACENDKGENNNSNRKEIIEVTDDMKNHKDALFSQVQYFEFESKIGFQVTGSAGSILNFKSNSFGNYNGSVIIELIEAYNYFDIIVNNLETRDVNGNLLETNGMLYIIAKDTSNNVLSLSKPMSLIFKDGNNVSYNLYNGLRKDNKIIWKLDKTSGSKRQKKYYAKKIIGYVVDNNNKTSTPYYDSIEVQNENEKLFLETLTMGWLNLDKVFCSDCKSDIVINVNKEFDDYSFYLIANNQNVIVSGNKIGNSKVKFNKIPRNVKFDCVASKFSNKTAFVVIDKIENLEKNGVNKERIKKITIKQFKDSLLLRLGDVSKPKW
jgi:hypothetical protein